MLFIFSALDVNPKSANYKSLNMKPYYQLANIWHNKAAESELFIREPDINMQDYLNDIKWNEAGLVAAIAQDYKTGEVLMMAWMNRESLALTVIEQRAVYWSRSRNKLWRKGESSGHEQLIKTIALDCDGDALLLSVEQKGEIACHTGRRSCFYRTLNYSQNNAQNYSPNSSLNSAQWETSSDIIKNPDEIYK